MPVDIYFGGAEHTTVHLLYSRFRNKFLYDIGVVPTSEPYRRRVQHGLIMGEDGRKMSKRRGNVINPDDVIAQYGADTMRAYIMFMGPYGDSAARSTGAISGISKFLNKIYILSDKIINQDSPETITLLHKTIKKVSEDIESISYHTAISQMMIFLNQVNTNGITKNGLLTFCQLLAPICPHITEEIRHKLGNHGSIHTSQRPVYDPALIIDQSIQMAVQYNGKTRGTITISPGANQEQALSLISQDEKLQSYIPNEVRKIVFVPGKIINIV